MHIKAIHMQNIRIHESFNLYPSPNVTVITGNNGSGKTSLIEALYIALQGTSFKGSDSEVLKINQPWWRIDVTFDDDTKRTVKFEPYKSSGRKQFTINNRQLYRLGSQHKYPIVLFEPDDLRLLHGSPTRRRQFIDRFISQLDPLYAVALKKYDRALKQRNNLLKNITKADLFAWDIILGEYGSYIIEKRMEFIENINTSINKAYNDIAASRDYLSIHYSHPMTGDVKQKIINELSRSSERDRLLGFTGIGPHRHDIIFHYNDSPALSVASRGEVRCIILALKFLEIDIIESITHKKPIILLDDVFSELDSSRQSALLSNKVNNQTFLTTTHLNDVSIHAKEIIL